MDRAVHWKMSDFTGAMSLDSACMLLYPSHICTFNRDSVEPDRDQSGSGAATQQVLITVEPDPARTQSWFRKRNQTKAVILSYLLSNTTEGDNTSSNTSNCRPCKVSWHRTRNTFLVPSAIRECNRCNFSIGIEMSHAAAVIRQVLSKSQSRLLQSRLKVPMWHWTTMWSVHRPTKTGFAAGWTTAPLQICLLTATTNWKVSGAKFGRFLPCLGWAWPDDYLVVTMDENQYFKWRGSMETHSKHPCNTTTVLGAAANSTRYFLLCHPLHSC